MFDDPVVYSLLLNVVSVVLGSMLYIGAEPPCAGSNDARW